MEQIKVKICGLHRVEDMDIANRYQPDYIGFVFATSKRKVDLDSARTLKKVLDSSIKVVGVFVNDDIPKIVQLCKEKIIDIIQLHGDEDVHTIERIRREVDNPMIKAIRVRSREDVLRAAELPCNYLLFDAYHEKAYGGVGECFDWSMIPNISKPYFLAGGVHLGNVTMAMGHKPFGIDVSSGVETNGYKDEQKVKEFISRVKQGRFCESQG